MNPKLTLAATLLATLTIGCSKDRLSEGQKDNGPTVQDDIEVGDDGELEDGEMNVEDDLDIEDVENEDLDEEELEDEEIEEEIEEELEDEEELEEEEEEEVEEESLVDREFASSITLDMRTYDRDDETDDFEDACEGTFMVYVSAEGAVTGDATCSLVTYSNVVFASLDAEVVGSSIVGDAIFTYNRQEIIVPIDGIIAEDRLWIDLEVEYDPTSQLTNEWEGSIEGAL